MMNIIEPDNLLDYVDAIFFFCLKRCNNRSDSEDLSQTILTEVLIRINKGLETDKFASYLWSVAHKQYARYVDSKVKDRDHEILYDQLDVLQSDENKLDDLLTDEKITLINQEIKMLSTDYNNILYRFYIEDMKLKTIAEELGLPLGTVKRKLFEIRKKLVEAFKMERLNGKKTYIPENYDFVMSYSNLGTYNPHNYHRTLIDKNILFHSYDNPCTLEDYSLELGISMPYIEDLIKRLEEATLIRKMNGKYVTNFAFMSKEIQYQLFDILKSHGKTISEKVLAFADKYFEAFVKIGFEGSHLSKGKLMWTWLLMIMWAIEETGNPCYEYTERPGNGRWDLLGYEQAEIPLGYYFVGRDMNNDYEGEYCCFNIKHPRLQSRKMMPGEESETLWYLYRKGLRNLEDEQTGIPEDYKKTIERLLDKSLIKIIDQKITLNIPVLSVDENQKVKRLLGGPDFQVLIQAYKDLVCEMKQKIQEYVPDYLNSQVGFITDCWASDIKCSILNEAEFRNELDFAEDEKRFPYNLLMICH
jgi:RNA polymerase sigma factor (sigma-70 family)